jgi:hypothetical protein
MQLDAVVKVCLIWGEGDFMQVPGTATKTLYGTYFEHKITGKSLQELGCSEVVIVKIQAFELHSLKSVTQIVDASEGLLSENEAYELKRVSRLARTCLKTFGKVTAANQVSSFTVFHNPCLYNISVYKRKGQPAPILWQVGWLLALIPPSEIMENGGQIVTLAKLKNIVVILKKRDIDLQDAEKAGLVLTRNEIRELNQLRETFKLKSPEVKVKRICCKEVEVV